MKVLVISDSHGNIANLKHVMGFAKRVKSGAVIHCGDWNNIEAVNTVLSFKIPLYSILGNADIDPTVEETLKKKSKKFERVYLEFELDGKKIGIIHDRKNPVSVDILFYGHTHRQFEEVIGGIKTVNPGALESSIDFAIYDTETNKVEFFND